MVSDAENRACGSSGDKGMKADVKTGQECGRHVDGMLTCWTRLTDESQGRSGSEEEEEREEQRQ